MSFDLKLEGGDLRLGNDGDLAKVANQDKLIQDVLKILFTGTGEHSLHLWYGTPLLSKVIGAAVDHSILKTEVNSAVSYGLNNLKLLQELQARDGQFITPKEQIAKIADIDCFFDQTDSRNLIVKFTIVAKSNDLITENFIIKT